MIIATDVRHRFENNGSVWTLTVPEMPAPGALIEFTTPKAGNRDGRTQRGWITADQTYARPGTFCVSATDEGSIWVEFVVERPARGRQ